jgi:hypothetical protein
VTAGGAALTGALVTAMALATSAHRRRPMMLAATAATGALGTAALVAAVAGACG